MQMSSVLRVFLVIRLGTRGDYRSAEVGVKANDADDADAAVGIPGHALSINTREM